MDPAALWYGTGGLMRVARGALWPTEWGYRGVVRCRNALFDAGWFAGRDPAVPSLSIGNLSVGGTGKTPVAAYVARRLVELGARPGIVMRGYGGDEAAVHAVLNPDVPVLTSPSREAGTMAARLAGCDVAVLDDAFQHRWIRRSEDVVLVSAEQWGPGRVRCLPTGPYREPLASLRRASLVLVTRKEADAGTAANLQHLLRQYATRDVGRVAFHLDVLRRVGGGGDDAPLSVLQGARVLAVAAIGAPESFAGQLRAAGGDVSLTSFPDHHGYAAVDVQMMLRRAEATDFVVCTLKDAEKLAALWPRAGPTLWYVSQRIALEEGEQTLDASLHRLMARRPVDSILR